MIRGTLLAVALAASVGAAAQPAALLVYQLAEPGLTPYPSRVVVSEQWLRMDDGADGGDFVLFDRAQRRVHAVSHGERTVLEIGARPVTAEPPIPLERSEELVSADTPPPPLAGREPVRYRLHANGERCLDLVAVPGLLEQATAALGEYQQALAGEHARLLPYLPADQFRPCDLALNIFAPRWPYRFGLPILSHDDQGRSRLLLTFDAAFDAPDELFTLPAGYRHYGPEEVPAL